jgi:hypothetical protein
MTRFEQDEANGRKPAAGDLILKTHVDVLRRNLHQVGALLDHIEEWRRDLHELLQLFDEAGAVWSRVDKLYSLVNGAKNAMDRKDSSQLAPQLEESLDEVKALHRCLSEFAVPKVREVGSRPLRKTEDVEATLRYALFGAAEEQLEALKEVEECIHEADRNPDRAREFASEAWTRFGGGVIEKSQQVFGEYIDFLRGLALRDTGFDQGICRMADHLIRRRGRLPGGYQWASLTLPARQAMLTRAQMIRLGFPEWTIWAVPLSLHAFGYYFVEQQAEVQDLVKRSGEERQPLVRECLADVFATWEIGPAYACAAILMRLDPLTALSDDKRSAWRAQVVLETLDRLSDDSSGRFADQIRRQLSAEWESALRQAGWEMALNPPNDAGGLSAEDVEEVREWINVMVRRLGRHCALAESDWAEISRWADALDAGTLDKIDFKNQDPGYVLNAAWICRMRMMDLSDLDTVEEAAHDLWRRLLETEAGTPAEADWMHRGPSSRPRPTGATSTKPGA